MELTIKLICRPSVAYKFYLFEVTSKSGDKIKLIKIAQGCRGVDIVNKLVNLVGDFSNKKEVADYIDMSTKFKDMS